MTRFARAHGSKSSNERLPEAATSWNVMKQQLRHKLQSSESVANSTITTQKIWKSSDFDQDVWNSNDVKWAVLEDTESAGRAINFVEENNNKLDKKNNKKNNKKKKHKSILNECLYQTTENKQKKKNKGKDVNSAEFDESRCIENVLTVSGGTVTQGSNTEKIKTKKLKKRANHEMNDTSEIKLEKRILASTNNTEHNLCFAKKQEIKHQQRGDCITPEETGKTVCYEIKTTEEFTTENCMKEKIGKKRKRKDNSISGMHDEQPVKKDVSELKENKKKVKSENCVAPEACDQRIKRKHKHLRDKNTIQESDCLNFDKQNFCADTGTVPSADVDVIPTEKKRKKKKHKGNVDDTTVKDVKGSLNYGKQNVLPEDSGSHADINFYLMQKKKKENKTKETWQQENNRKFMKNQFSVEDRKRKKGKYEKNYLYTTVLHMNGKAIEIVKFDGFPIKKEDAENLIQLKKKMIANGIPASEIKATMKLERRKAEKALAREKKKVCFHCRSSGHVLSECAELGKTDTDEPIGTGICFKCGSTEHKHFECRVTREQEFRYAKCFICNEQGHIARQCPDNPRGLYPKGGACHLCGDVTHLKKDCPDLIKEKAEKTIKLPTLCSKTEALEDDDKNLKPVSHNHVNKKKTVKF